MRAAEFLRALVTMLDSMEDDKEKAPQSPITINVNGGGSVQQAEKNDTETALDTDKFVPPLQQKIELMKNMAGQSPKEAIADEDEPFEG